MPQFADWLDDLVLLENPCCPEPAPSPRSDHGEDGLPRKPLPIKHGLSDSNLAWNDKVQQSNGLKIPPEQQGIASCRGTLWWCLVNGVFLAEKSP